MVLWMSLASFIASLLSASTIKDLMIEHNAFQINSYNWTVLLFPIGGLLLVSFGIALGQSEGKAIIKLLEKSLQATNVERLSSSIVFSKSNLISVGVIAIFILSGTALGFSSNVQHKVSAEAELLSFYTCSKPSENDCVETSYFNKKPIEIYACGYIQTSSQSRVGIYWYHESTERPIYSAIDIWLEPGFFCEKLSVAEYASGRYTVKMYQGRDVLGQYDFALK